MTIVSNLRINRRTIGRDVVAGMTAGIAAIPDGMASAVLAGVNPVYGLYNLIVGTPMAALFTSSVYMAVINTSAMALVVNSALSGYAETEQEQVIITLGILVGLFQLALGLFKLGYLTRFISNSVMTGFLTGIAIIIILGQLGDFTGYSGEGANKIAQTIDLLRNLDQVNLPTLAVGLITLALIVILDRTRLNSITMLVALIVATVIVLYFGLDSVAQVGDTTDIPNTLPNVKLPSPGLVLELLLPAVAIGLIGLVQAAGVSQGYPNPDGKFPDASGDFRGQGLANVAAGFFQGLPVGGSVSGTALVVNAGARSRWANIFTGLVVALGVLLFGNQIEKLPMTALAAILIYAGYQTLKPERIRSVWQTNKLSRTVMVVALVFTLYLPVQQAIFLSVALQIVLVVFKTAERMTIMELVPLEGGDFREQSAPKVLPNHQVTILLPHGSLFFAGAADFEEEAPSADLAKGAVVVLILRGRGELGSTAINVLKRYALALKKGDGRLILAEVDEVMRVQLARTGALAVFGAENVLPANPLLLASVQEAWARAEAVLAEGALNNKLIADYGLPNTLQNDGTTSQ